MATKNSVGLEVSLISPVIDSLKNLLADYQVFYTNLRGLHWDIKGDKFFELHELYEEYYDEVADVIDEIAERIIMLGGHPENRFSEYLKSSEIKEQSGVSDWLKGVQGVVKSLEHLLQKCRELHALAIKAGDAGTVSLALHRIKDYEKKLWMLSAYLVE